MSTVEISGRKIGLEHPTYFVADIAANHDGDLGRAVDLIYKCAEAGADVAKFQHFTASTIASDFGFRALGGQVSHQSSWRKSVFDVYDDASVNPDWTPILKETCDKAGITFMTSPYSPDLVDAVDPYVPAYKVGSGDLTWFEIIDKMVSKRKPILLATGASTFDEVVSAMDHILPITQDVILMQCNTNYTAELENFRFIQLRVLTAYQKMFPNVVLGLSDHTPGHATVLGAVALGARAIEKHFTDDITRAGPDHRFSMDPRTWRVMVDRTRELEMALGTAVKRVEGNEKETVILQRRSIRVCCGVMAGTPVTRDILEVLRPCPPDALPPYQIGKVLGMHFRRDMKAGEHILWTDLI